jgi:hypothetical protein
MTPDPWRSHGRRAIVGWVCAAIAVACAMLLEPDIGGSEGPEAPGAVWLWAGVPFSQVPEAAGIIYVYQGVIVEHGGAVDVVHRGVYPIGGDTRVIVPVVRFRGQPPAEAVARHLEALAAAWEARGRTVRMVQIDRDVPSGRVGALADFVTGVRAHLDRRYALSVTGLADWLVAAPRADLLRLSHAADEIVFQLYHEHHQVPRIERYDTALAAFEAPFKVGVLQGMAVPRRASRSANWRGSVTFLLRERQVRRAPIDPS